MDDDEASLINAYSRSKYATTLEPLRSLELPEDNELNLWNSRVWNRLTFDGFSSVGMIAALLWPAWTESSDCDPTQEMAPYDDVPNWDGKGWHRVVRGTMMWSFADPFPVNSIRWAMIGGDFQAQWLL
uniref:Uncharacterized protein n=1 Tax=Plectus sambesii TaxID=2011161 RepID=A0A914WXN0_9BILA